ncbi:Hypothetical protein D9617_99g092430 [Elsinoe fawcettii]|nr:Hypothetical protein D9617_99g092430 [Elsinoe fawcettii]
MTRKSMTDDASTPYRPGDEVLRNSDLLRMILLLLPPTDVLFRANLVNPFWRNLIQDSKVLQDKIYGMDNRRPIWWCYEANRIVDSEASDNCHAGDNKHLRLLLYYRPTRKAKDGPHLPVGFDVRHLVGNVVLTKADIEWKLLYSTTPSDTYLRYQVFQPVAPTLQLEVSTPSRLASLRPLNARRMTDMGSNTNAYKVTNDQGVTWGNVRQALQEIRQKDDAVMIGINRVREGFRIMILNGSDVDLPERFRDLHDNTPLIHP